MNNIIQNLWSDLRSHPACNEDSIRITRMNILFASTMASVDKFTYSRNELIRQIAVLDMIEKLGWVNSKEAKQ